MSQLLVKHCYITQVELSTIVANASFLWERLDRERFVVAADKTNEQTIENRLNRWCQTSTACSRTAFANMGRNLTANYANGDGVQS